MVIGIIGFLGFIISIGWLIISFIRKQPKKKPGLAIVISIVLFFIGVSMAPEAKNSATNTNTNTQQPVQKESVAETQASKVPAAPVEQTVPAEYKSALRKATSYANTMNMSKIGVYNQLTSEYGEKFSQEAGQYAIDNVKTDWKANALAKAKTYQESMAMSPASIRDQLVSEYGENFTAEEADYAIQHLND